MASLIFALCIVGALLTTLSRAIGWKRILGYATCIDVIATVLIMLTFSGSTAGLAAGAAAGLILSIVLTVGRWLCGFQTVRLTRSGLVYVTTPSPALNGLKNRLSGLLRPSQPVSGPKPDYSAFYKAAKG